VRIYISILLLLVSAPFLLAQSEAKILAAIAQVESGNNPRAVGDYGKAVGAYQMHPAAWADANAYRVSIGLPELPRRRWREEGVQEGVAKAFLAVLEARLSRAGYKTPTPGLLALCWNKGYAGAKARGFRLNDYARRVEILTIN
jgi:Transglycosylase SLT domain